MKKVIYSFLLIFLFLTIGCTNSLISPDNPIPPNIPISIKIIDDDASFSITIDWPGVIYAAGYRVYKSNSQYGTYINTSGDITESEYIDLTFRKLKFRLS